MLFVADKVPLFPTRSHLDQCGLPSLLKTFHIDPLNLLFYQTGNFYSKTGLCLKLKKGKKTQFFIIEVLGAQWLSGRVLDSRKGGGGFEPHGRHCALSLSKTH